MFRFLSLSSPRLRAMSNIFLLPVYIRCFLSKEILKKPTKNRSENRRKTFTGGNPAIDDFPHFEQILTSCPREKNISSRHKKCLLSRLIKQIVCDRFCRLVVFLAFFSHILKITLDTASPRKLKSLRMISRRFTPFLANERFSIFHVKKFLYSEK